MDERSRLARCGVSSSITWGLPKMKRYVYSEVNDMKTIRILHHHEPGHGWSFDSPDVPGMVGGTENYDPAHAEEAARFTLECIAEEQGRAAPANVSFEHYVPAGVAVTA
jgi:hypothetical protein